MQDDPQISDAEYLEMFKISDGKYLIGIFEQGITVYKQQVRALNIFHALITEGIIRRDKEFKIGIIGGGVAGLTFAAAALKANLMVTIFEREANYLHMQYGCDTRKVHPHIYEWPDKGSTKPDAGLPVLNWRYDTASVVCKQIINGFNEIRKDIKIEKNYRYNDFLSEHQKCNIVSIEEKPTEDYRFTIQANVKGNTFRPNCHLLIYATGYGIERDKYSVTDTPSYWRNDSYAQTFLAKKQSKFLISGVGDGALIDLFRLRIEDFDYDFIIDIINDSEYAPNLIEKLRQIKEKGLKFREKAPKSFYYDEFENIGVRDYEHIIKLLSGQYKLRDSIIVLNGSGLFEQSLDFNKISMMNAFLAYVLYKEDLFEYREGRLIYMEEYACNCINRPIGGRPFYERVGDYTIIARHGTDYKDLFTEGILSAAEIKNLPNLEKRQTSEINFGRIKKRWKDADLDAIFDRRSYKVLKNYSIEGEPEPPEQEKEAPKSPNTPTAYVTPDTISLFSAYISVLSETLKVLQPDAHFRMTVQRLYELDGESFFQQITNYYGTGEFNVNQGVRRLFNHNRGNTGLSFLSGLPVLIVNKNEQKFQEIAKNVHLGKSYNPRGKKAFLSIPVLAPIGKDQLGNDRYGTAIVLYADAAEVNFFSEREIIKVIIGAVRGMIRSLNQQLEQKQIYMNDLEISPVILDKNKITKEILENECFIQLGPLFDEDYEKNVLKFDEFYSFDIINSKTYAQLKNIR